MGVKNKIKERRIKLGVSQAELSRATGIPKSTLSRYEMTGQEVKKVEMLAALDRFFDNMERGKNNTNVSIDLAVRHHFAGIAMQGLTSTLSESTIVTPKLAALIAKESVILADALITELNNESEVTNG